MTVKIKNNLNKSKAIKLTAAKEGGFYLVVSNQADNTPPKGSLLYFPINNDKPLSYNNLSYRTESGPIYEDIFGDVYVQEVDVEITIVGPTN